MPLQEIGGGGTSFAAGPSSTNFATAFLYEASPGLPVTSANSYALLVARLTEWQRRQHEADLVASWEDWWQANTRARTHLSQLRKCPQVGISIYWCLFLMWPIQGFEGDYLSCFMTTLVTF